ncbi:MAG TPA: dihydrodipicolinate synthase family protein [Pirellulaceae bacterium]|jgi:4-hydroxy-tetrahydrodipicolinate synthase|nr:dihydrodipicolinate synthase family protein [Pirellulaceae bacterium]
MTEPNERPEGLICPMITPLTTARKLDVEAVDRLVEHLIAGGVSAIFILGTSGEAPSLSAETKRELITRTADRIASRLPWYCGVGHTSLEESLKLASFAAEKGASAIGSTTPYYYPLTQEQVRRWFESLADRQMLPVILYNYPKLTKTPIEIETAAQLLAHDNVVAIKDSAGELDYVRALCERFAGRADKSVLVGPQRLLVEALALGAQGGVCSGTNLFPSRYVALYEAAKAGKKSEVARLNAVVARILATILPEGGGDAANLVAALKASAAALRLCESHLAFPLTQPEQALTEHYALAVQALRDELDPKAAA